MLLPRSPWCLLLLLSCSVVNVLVDGQLMEEDRLKEYRARNYKWPLTEVVPNTEGWRKKQFRRLAQVERIQDTGDRYNAWVAIMPPALVAQNFTENGWGLTRAPQDLMDDLLASLHNGLDSASTEKPIDAVEATDETRPWFIPQPELNERALEVLKPHHESWSGVSLEGAVAYGLRVYRNTSSLNMHVDKLRTHVISCILHVDHSDDAEPWPLYIEDFQGNTNEVVLESGDMLFYESSKCIHGRPRPLNGSWYSSLFVHYYPTGWDQEQQELEVHYAIPPIWHETQPLTPQLEDITMVGTSMRENSCPHGWCGTKDAVLWEGPGKEGLVITTGHKEGIPLEPFKGNENNDEL